MKVQYDTMGGILTLRFDIHLIVDLLDSRFRYEGNLVHCSDILNSPADNLI